MKNWLGLNHQNVFISAEIGCNHNGNLEIAKKLIDVSAECGADAVKFQSFVPEEMITPQAPKAKYQIRATGSQESQFDRLKRLSLSKADHLDLQSYSRSKQILFFSSPFDISSANLLKEIDIPFFKIASGEITNYPLIKKVVSFNKPVILSTGMATVKEIEEVLDLFDNKSQLILMHCVSDYPAAWSQANLKAIQVLAQKFKLPVGFSDHTEGFELSLVAVGLGAVAIEKHITLDKNMEGGDHKASLIPEEFKEFVFKIREVEKSLGDGIKRCMAVEENVKQVARKSLVAFKPIKKGTVITAEDIVIKRPGVGIEPKYLEKVIGTRAKEDIPGDQLIQWEQIQGNGYEAR